MTKNKMFDKIKYHKLPSAETLANMYFKEKLSTVSIAKLYGSSSTAVRLKLKRYGYNLRSIEESLNLVANYIHLNGKLLEFLDGHLLGDGSIILSPNGKSACFIQASKYYEYIMWLANQLVSFGVRILKIYNEISYGISYFILRTKYYRDFVKVRKRWYPNGRRIVPKDIHLSPNMLKYWYLDDGSYRAGRNGTKKGEKVILCMYDEKSRPFLINRLLKIGIDATNQKTGIYIRAKSRKEFFHFMLSEEPYIPKCFIYKFPKHYIK